MFRAGFIAIIAFVASVTGAFADNGVVQSVVNNATYGDGTQVQIGDTIKVDPSGTGSITTGPEANVSIQITDAAGNVVQTVTVPPNSTFSYVVSPTQLSFNVQPAFGIQPTVVAQTPPPPSPGVLGGALGPAGTVVVVGGVVGGALVIGGAFDDDSD